MTGKLFGALELGGTKAICMVGEDLNNLTHQTRIATTTPEETLRLAAAFFNEHGPIKALGIGSFGPLDVDPQSPSYGNILATPKAGWSHTPVKAHFEQALQCDVVIDTDVNAAALGEYRLGAAQGLRNALYITVGTGIGGGALLNGASVIGLTHPEMGHMPMSRASDDAGFTSVCPFHPNCIEGLASGTAVRARWGKALNELPQTHRAWTLEADYLAQFFASLTLAYAPDRIIVGGGVSTEALLAMVRPKLQAHLNGYVNYLDSAQALQTYLCLPELGDNAGPYGSFLLTQSHAGVTSL